MDHEKHGLSKARRQHEVIVFSIAALVMLCTLLTPAHALLHSNLPHVPTRAAAFTRIGGRSHATLPPPMRLTSATTYLPFNRIGKQENYYKEKGRPATIAYLSAITADDDSETERVPLTEDEDEEFTRVPLMEDEEFKAALEEVKDAAKNVTESSVKFTSAIVTKGPGIIGRLLGTLVSKGFRYVRRW